MSRNEVATPSSSCCGLAGLLQGLLDAEQPQGLGPFGGLGGIDGSSSGSFVAAAASSGSTLFSAGGCDGPLEQVAGLGDLLDDQLEAAAEPDFAGFQHGQQGFRRDDVQLVAVAAAHVRAAARPGCTCPRP